MSAKSKAISRIVLHDSTFNNFDAMTPDELAEQEAKVEALIDGDDLGYMGHYVPIACAASRAWDAAIGFSANEAKE